MHEFASKPNSQRLIFNKLTVHVVNEHPPVKYSMNVFIKYKCDNSTSGHGMVLVTVAY